MTLSPEHAAQFKTWLQEHRGILVRVARSFAPAAADAADLQQEMLLQLWTSLSTYSHSAHDTQHRHLDRDPAYRSNARHGPVVAGCAKAKGDPAAD